MRDDICQTHSDYSVFWTSSETVAVNRFLFLIKSMAACFSVNKMNITNYDITENGFEEFAKKINLF